MNNTIFIVTGAAGHLGSHIVRELLCQGKEVRAFVLPGETCPDFIDVNRDLLSEYTGNVCDLDSLETIFGNSKGKEFIVIHCAGIITISKREDHRVRDVNIGGTTNIIKMCKQNPVKRLVYTSSVHAIPTLPHGQTMREISSFNPNMVPGYYDKTKAIATQLVLDAAKDGLDAVIVHPSGIIGPNGLFTGNMTQLISLYLRGRLSAAVHGGFDFVDVRDVATGIIKAAERGRKGENYILSNRFIKLKEMFDTLAKVSGRRKLKVYLPLWIAKAAAPFMELYYALAKKTPLFTHYSLKTLSENGVFSHDKASKELGYSTRSLKETLADMVLWLKQGDMIPQ